MFQIFVASILKNLLIFLPELQKTFPIQPIQSAGPVRRRVGHSILPRERLKLIYRAAVEESGAIRPKLELMLLLQKFQTFES